MNAHEHSKELAALLRKEQGSLADFLLSLARFDERRSWRELGHTSLFYYLRRELGLSAGAAQYRKTAAELVQSFPEVEDALRGGRLCLSTVIELAKVITPENRHEVLPRFFGLSRREGEMLAASIRPVEDAPSRDVVTRVRHPASAAARVALEPQPAPEGEGALAFRPAEMNETAAQATSSRPAEKASTTPAESAEPAAGAAPQRDEVKPLGRGRARLHTTVSSRFLETLQATKDALSHARPGATTEEVLQACMELMLAHCAKRRGNVARPREEPRPSRGGGVPAHVKREVWKRAGGRCEWRHESGEVCGATSQLELDHLRPRALGGPSTVENLRLHCRGHNLLAARRVFGDAWMDRFTRGRAPGRPPTPAARLDAGG